MTAASLVVGGTTYRPDVRDAFANWFASPQGRANGGAFRLRIPVPATGDASLIGSVTVVLSNAAGSSEPVTGSR